jgi:hypothetical protein
MVDIIVTSMGTGDSRALNVSPAGVFWALAICPMDAGPNHRIAAHSEANVNVRRIAVVSFNAQALFLEIADFNFKFAQIIRGLQYHFKPISLKGYLSPSFRKLT